MNGKYRHLGWGHLVDYLCGRDLLPDPSSPLAIVDPRLGHRAPGSYLPCVLSEFLFSGACELGKPGSQQAEQVHSVEEGLLGPLFSLSPHRRSSCISDLKSHKLPWESYCH